MYSNSIYVRISIVILAYYIIKIAIVCEIAYPIYHLITVHAYYPLKYSFTSLHYVIYI